MKPGNPCTRCGKPHRLIVSNLDSLQKALHHELPGSDNLRCRCLSHKVGTMPIDSLVLVGQRLGNNQSCISSQIIKDDCSGRIGLEMFGKRLFVCGSCKGCQERILDQNKFKLFVVKIALVASFRFKAKCGK